MNNKVYYVQGGMEDWAFAGSWDPDRVVECTPGTFGGYPPRRPVRLALLIRRWQQRRRYVEHILSDNEEFGVSLGPYSDDPAEDADVRVVT